MIGNSWDNVLEEEFEKEYFLKIKEFVEAEYKTKTIYPPKEERNIQCLQAMSNRQCESCHIRPRPLS